MSSVEDCQWIWPKFAGQACKLSIVFLPISLEEIEEIFRLREENSEKGGSIGYFGVWSAEGGKFEEIWEEITKFPLVFYRKIVNSLCKSSKFSPAAG